jgi:hypothetical protein
MPIKSCGPKWLKNSWWKSRRIKESYRLQSRLKELNVTFEEYGRQNCNKCPPSGGSSNGHTYYIGLDVHKKTISYCVKDAGSQIHQ